MAEIGNLNTLKVVRKAPQGVYLQGDGESDILLPNKYLPENCEIDQEIEVFVYRDSEDRIIATTLIPTAMIGQFACLKVVATSKFGAFLDWGLEKDLFVPFKEQKFKMHEGEFHVVGIYLDESTDRIAASSKLGQFLNHDTPDLSENQQVEAMVYQENEQGYKCIVNDTYLGMIYSSDTFDKFEKGDKIKCWVRKIRPDNKIDLSLLPAGYAKIDDIASHLLQQLQENNGYIPLSDKSPSDLIAARLGISKKNFKKAVGFLYKNKFIDLEKVGIRLTEIGKNFKL